MNRAVLILGGLGLAGAAAVAFGSSASAAPGTKPPPAKGPGIAGGLKTATAPAPPPTALSWSASCLPTFHDEAQLHLWAYKLGENQVKGQTAEQLLESGARAAMGRCWPPPADLTPWQPLLHVIYRAARAYLQGLVFGGHLTRDAAQELLSQGRAFLLARGVEELLPPTLYNVT